MGDLPANHVQMEAAVAKACGQPAPAAHSDPRRPVRYVRHWSRFSPFAHTHTHTQKKKEDALLAHHSYIHTQNVGGDYPDRLWPHTLNNTLARYVFWIHSAIHKTWVRCDYLDRLWTHTLNNNVARYLCLDSFCTYVRRLTAGRTWKSS